MSAHMSPVYRDLVWVAFRMDTELSLRRNVLDEGLLLPTL